MDDKRLYTHTDEERTAVQNCLDEAFWYRSLPLGTSFNKSNRMSVCVCLCVCVYVFTYRRILLIAALNRYGSPVQ